MNRTILRTSLFWLILFALGASFHLYRTRAAAPSSAVSTGVAPLAAGPPAVGPLAAGPTPEPARKSPLPTAASEPRLAPVQLTDSQRNSIGVQTGTVEYKQLSDTLRATGSVAVDERLQSAVQIRFNGTIRKVFADATYKYVRKGDPLFTIYSPELVATQEEYLLARRNQAALGLSAIDGVASGASSLTTAAEQRLRQWDIPASEIARLERTGKALTELSIHAPASGYVMERMVLPDMYVEPSTRLYTLADLSRVWIDAQVFQNDLARIKRGEPVAITVDAYPGRILRGRVEQILPQIDLATRTVRVRIAVNNPGILLKPGMFVDVDFKSMLGRQLVVPASAVFQTGLRQVVFLDHGNGSFEPTEVSVGTRVGEDLIVLKGLRAGQAIVTSANFLLDSESQLQAAAGSSTSPTPGQQSAPPPSSGAPAISLELTTDPNPAHKGSNLLHVKLTRPDGQPVAAAAVTASFFMPAMPAMGMGAMKTTAQLTQKGPGLYEGTAVLQSGGTWQVTLTATQNGQLLGTRQLRLNAEGGM